jgi:DNA-binding transcriptional LysR family regulator
LLSAIAILSICRERWPDVQVSLVQGMPRDLIGYLLEGVADIAICTEELKQHSNLNSKGFYRWFHAVCAPLEHDIFSEDVTLKRLAKQPILTYIHNITCRDSLDRAFQKQKLHPNIVLEAADTDVLKTFIRLKMGCGVVASMAYSPQEDSVSTRKSVFNLPHFEFIFCEESAFSFQFLDLPPPTIAGKIFRIYEDIALLTMQHTPQNVRYLR